jgi:hypothetical protein
MKEQIQIFDSAARTASPADANITAGSTAGFFVINVTAYPAAASVVFAVNGVSKAGTEFNIITSAAITATGTTVLRVFPGATAVANLAVNDMLPQGLNITATHADTDSITYSVEFIGVF